MILVGFVLAMVMIAIMMIMTDDDSDSHDNHDDGSEDNDGSAVTVMGRAMIIMATRHMSFLSYPKCHQAPHSFLH